MKNNFILLCFSVAVVCSIASAEEKKTVLELIKADPLADYILRQFYPEIDRDSDPEPKKAAPEVPPESSDPNRALKEAIEDLQKKLRDQTSQRQDSGLSSLAEALAGDRDKDKKRNEVNPDPVQPPVLPPPTIPTQEKKNQNSSGDYDLERCRPQISPPTPDGYISRDSIGGVSGLSGDARSSGSGGFVGGGSISRRSGGSAGNPSDPYRPSQGQSRVSLRGGSGVDHAGSPPSVGGSGGGRPIAETPPSKPTERSDSARDRSPFSEMPKTDSASAKKAAQEQADVKSKARPELEEKRTKAQVDAYNRELDRARKEALDQENEKRAAREKVEAKRAEAAKNDPKENARKLETLKKILALAKALNTGGNDKKAGEALASLMRKWASDGGLAAENGRDPLDDLRVSLQENRLDKDDYNDELIRRRIYWASEILYTVDMSKKTGLGLNNKKLQSTSRASAEFVKGFVDGYKLSGTD